MNALDIHQLTKTYDNGVQAVKQIDLSIKKGDFFALLGINGAGKSTTIGLITTLLKKTSGTIHINGYDIDTYPEIAKSFLGVVPQEMNLNVFEPCEQILLNQAGFYGLSRKQAYSRLDPLLEQLGLLDKKKVKARYLSGGMKRRLMIGRALMHQPSILILDEPTAGVDIEIRRNMWDFLKQTNEQGTTIILTTHYLEEAEQLCKNVAIIHQGKIIEKTSVAQLLASMNTETFIFTTHHPLPSFAEPTPFPFLPLDTYNFEIQVNRRISLNEVFTWLTGNHILIHSIRNKTNRLEALFMDRIQNGSE